MWQSDDLVARLSRLPAPGTRVAPSGPASAEEDMRQAMPRGDHDLNPGLYDPDAPLREAAVLVPIIRRPGELTVLLTRRAKHLPDHPGQISFPGGGVDPEDADAEAAALREAREEVGLPPDRVTVVGRLDTYLVRTGFRVVPVVGLLQPPFELQPEQGEVDEIFEVPLAFFLDPANRELHSRMFRGAERFFYAYPFGDYYIWGATAGMLSNLSEVLLQPDLLRS
ncbi:CoA pyrophosphatase [Pelagibius sp. CAU 1746]|uniref:CoA pyrophosphatase n=1 Tax=Pelagibius sp. CAU 1746 TaxID=3140370 RepID=UPI00325AF762